MSYYTKITTAGLAAITAAMNNNAKVPITYMAFGDGNGSIPEPDENAISLVNEVYRVGVNKVEVHNKNPNWLVCEAIIPSAVGGFNIREVALYDSSNSMLAIANYPPTYKPTVEEGAAKIQTIRIIIQVDNSGSFELIVDPDVVLATMTNVNEAIDQNQNNVSVKKYGAKGNSSILDHTYFQENATACDNEQLSYMYIPMRNEGYPINETVGFKIPTMIFGNKGASYNRGSGKKGNILIGANAEYAFDLGLNATSAQRNNNPADNWTIKNIGFLPAEGIASRTKSAMKVTVNTNGPDRGLVLREISASRLKHVVDIQNPEKETVIANLIVENSCLSNNELPLKATGNVLGARIVGNQIEQNAVGALHGTFNSAVYLADNMLEGQPNPIKIDIPPTTGNRTSLVVHRNYFEQNTGDFIADYRTSAGPGFIDFAYNWTLHLNGKDYIRVSSGYPTIFNKDPQPVTFVGGGASYGSDFLSYAGINYYKQRSIPTGGLSGLVAIKDHFELMYRETNATQASNISSAVNEYNSPYGKVKGITNGWVDIPVSVVAGEILNICLFASIPSSVSSGSFVMQIYDAATTAVLGETVSLSYGSNGKWTLFSCCLKAKSASAGKIRLRFYASPALSEPVVIAGCCAKSVGTYANDADVVKVTPEMPQLFLVDPFPSKNLKLTYSWTGNLTADTEISVEIPFNEILLGDFVLPSITQAASLVKKLHAVVLKPGFINLSFTPASTSNAAVLGFNFKVIKD